READPRGIATKGATSTMRKGKYPFILAFLLPPVGVYAVFMLSPYIQAIQISFSDWSGLATTWNYIGFDNYVRMWNDDQLRTALWNNIILLLVVPFVTVLLGLFFASMINVGGRRRGAAISGVRG